MQTLEPRVLYADMERPDLAFDWRERQVVAGREVWVPIDFTAQPHTFKLDFLAVPSGLRVYQKTTDITGYAATIPNVIAVLSVDELIALRGRFNLRLWARNSFDNKDRPFRPNDLPQVIIKSAPVNV